MTATGGRLAGRELPAEVELATALGDMRSAHVVVNELTTVASGYSLAQFAVEGAVGGPNPGLLNAALMPRNFVSLASGRVAPFLARHPNGTETETVGTFNSLASIIAGCQRLQRLSHGGDGRLGNPAGYHLAGDELAAHQSLR